MHARLALCLALLSATACDGLPFVVGALDVDAAFGLCPAGPQDLAAPPEGGSAPPKLEDDAGFPPCPLRVDPPMLVFDLRRRDQARVDVALTNAGAVPANPYAGGGWIAAHYCFDLDGLPEFALRAPIAPGGTGAASFTMSLKGRSGRESCAATCGMVSLRQDGTSGYCPVPFVIIER